MSKTASHTSTAYIERLALLVSHVLSPALLATLLLLLSPLRSDSITWPEAVTAALFTTVLPWIVLALAKLRGAVSDLHITQRHQRHWIYAVTAALILGGLATLWGMNASGAIFLAVLSIFAGLLVVSLINLWWKVSVHLAVGTYVALQLAAPNADLMPAVTTFVAVLSWARIRSNQHTASQVLGGVLVGVAIKYVGDWLSLFILGS